MADPIRERILQQIESDLLTITTVNGFEQTIEKVHRDNEAVIQMDERPALSIVDRGDIKRRHIRLGYENTMQLEILAFTLEHEDDERVMEISRLHADVEKIVAANERWNDGSINLANRTFMTGLTTSQGETTQPYATALTVLTILYRVQELDPYAVRDV